MQHREKFEKENCEWCKLLGVWAWKGVVGHSAPHTEAKLKVPECMNGEVFYTVMDVVREINTVSMN